MVRVHRYRVEGTSRTGKPYIDERTWIEGSPTIWVVRLWLFSEKYARFRMVYRPHLMGNDPVPEQLHMFDTNP